MTLHLADFPPLERATRHWSHAWLECLEHYAQALYDKSGSMDTLYAYMYTLARFYVDVPEPERVSRQDCERFVHQPMQRIGHQGESISTATRNLRLTILSSWYTFCSGYTVESKDGPVPLFRAALPTAGMKHAQANKVYRQFSEEEVRKFFASIDTNTVLGARDYSVFLAYFYTSRRRNEIASLTWGDLAPYTFPGGRQGMIYRFRNKGESRIESTDEWPVEVHTALLKYLEMSGRLPTMDADSPLWVAAPNRTGGGLPRDPWKPIGGDTLWVRFVRICQAAGIPKDRRCIHSFRHTSARLRYEAGEDIVSISKHLFHKSLQTTTIYMAALTSAEDKGARLLAERFKDL